MACISVPQDPAPPLPPCKHSIVHYRDEVAGNKRRVSDLCYLMSCVSPLNMSPVPSFRASLVLANVIHRVSKKGPLPTAGQ